MTRRSTISQGSYRPQHFRAESYDPAQSVGYLLRQVLNGFTHEIEAQLEPSGLTDAQWLPLYKLSLHTVSTAAEIARTMGRDAGATTRLLDRLEAKGLCQRERSEHDRRVVELRLTAEGREAVRVVPEVLCHVHNRALADFSAEEIDTLKKLLQRMLCNLQPAPAGGQVSPDEQ